jgi:SPP1 family predicted phage head-tail adaptor
MRDPLAIDAGQLRHQVTVQAQAGAAVPAAVTGMIAAQGEAGWADVLTCMAAIRTLSAGEKYQAGQDVAQVTHEITVRWPGDSVVVGGQMRVLFGARKFTIQAVDNVLERNRVLKLMCMEIDGGK